MNRRVWRRHRHLFDLGYRSGVRRGCRRSGLYSAFPYRFEAHVPQRADAPAGGAQVRAGGKHVGVDPSAVGLRQGSGTGATRGRAVARRRFRCRPCHAGYRRRGGFRQRCPASFPRQAGGRGGDAGRAAGGHAGARRAVRTAPFAYRQQSVEDALPLAARCGSRGAGAGIGARHRGIPGGLRGVAGQNRRKAETAFGHGEAPHAPSDGTCASSMRAFPPPRCQAPRKRRRPGESAPCVLPSAAAAPRPVRGRGATAREPAQSAPPGAITSRAPLRPIGETSPATSICSISRAARL